jgi:hypothetical protein
VPESSRTLTSIESDRRATCSGVRLCAAPPPSRTPHSHHRRIRFRLPSSGIVYLMQISASLLLLPLSFYHQIWKPIDVVRKFEGRKEREGCRSFRSETAINQVDPADTVIAPQRRRIKPLILAQRYGHRLVQYQRAGQHRPQRTNAVSQRCSVFHGRHKSSV